MARRLPPPGGALVVDGDRIGLGVVRSLGRQGIPVWVLVEKHRVATVSRYARRTLHWPDRCEQARVDFLLDLVRREGLKGWLIYPTTDELAAFLARHHAVLSRHVRLTSPPWDSLRWGYDKRLTHALAAELGIEYPETVYPRNRDEVAALDCAFPIIIKPALKPDVNRLTRAKAWRADSRGELLARYDQAAALVDPSLLMIQRMIPGGGEAQLSYAALCRNGRTLAAITACRRRQYPIDFGFASSFVETIEDPEVERLGRRLLAGMRFSGLAEVEFKRDADDGRLKLLEVNPRLWGWHSIGRRAGIDFPYLLFRLLGGEAVPRLRARTGVRWVRMLTDLPAAALELRRGSLGPTEYLRSLGGPVEREMFVADDPLPGLLELPILAGVELGVLLHRRHAGAVEPGRVQPAA